MRLLSGLVLLMGVAGFVASSGFSVLQASKVGNQLGPGFALFGMGTMAVVAGAKLFGMGCVTFGRSWILRISGGALALACALVTGTAVWWWYMKFIRVPMHGAEFFPWSLETHAILYAANIAFAAEVMTLFACVVPALWNEDGLFRPRWSRA